MENNSGKGVQFGFSKSDAENVEQKVDKSNSPVEGTQLVNKQDKPEEDLEEEYTDRRTITISLVKNYSLYRKVNDKVLPKRKDYIGGSIKSSRTLSSNKEEVDTYFPNIIGLSPNDPNFISRVKQYLNNIRIPVDELGRIFDISFHYFHKKDYYKIKAEEEKIEETAPGSGKYEPNTVGAVIELLKKSDPNDILYIRDTVDKSSKIITDIERKITMKNGITYMEIAPGDPMQV